jgi:universal stress protein A
MNYRKILCALDFSEVSRAALREAAELSAKFGAELTLVHVAQGLSLSGLSEQIADERVLPSRQALERQLLAEWKDEAWRRSERPVHSVWSEGTPWEQIVVHAREGNFDLIVVGSHGRTGLKHALVGSVAENVVRHAPCPVFVVRTKGGA